MHKCSKCGNEFEGKFCPECGEKYVDDTVCPRCGAKREPNVKFCPECGLRLDGKKVCYKCGAEADGTFCPECGTRLGGNKERDYSVAGALKKYTYLAGIICVLLSALMGLVFTFVCGVSLKSGNVSETNMLYYYFGEAYKDVKDAVDMIEVNFNWVYIGETREFALYFPAAIGTAVSALGILGAVALTALTAFKAYKKFYKNEEANVVVPAVATFLTFATLATVLLFLSSAEASGGKTVFSKATLAGLITGGIFCGLGVVLIVASRYKELCGRNTATSYGLSAAVCVFTVVLVAVAALPAVYISASAFDFGSMQAMRQEVRFGLFSGMQSALMLISGDGTVNELLAYSAVGGAAGIAVAVIGAVVILRRLSSLCDGNNKGNIVLCAANVLLSVIYVTLAVLFAQKFSEMAFNYDEVSVTITVAVPVVMLVMSVLSLVSEVANKIVNKQTY